MEGRAGQAPIVARSSVICTPPSFSYPSSLLHQRRLMYFCPGLTVNVVRFFAVKVSQAAY